jgi:hypothetical protein
MDCEFGVGEGREGGNTGILTAPPRFRRVPRLRVTPYEEQGVVPHYNPGPDAVRVCNAHYEQEYRPSGTVIVPRMHCYWTRDPRARAVAD